MVCVCVCVCVLYTVIIMFEPTIQSTIIIISFLRTCIMSSFQHSFLLLLLLLFSLSFSFQLIRQSFTHLLANYFCYWCCQSWGIGDSSSSRVDSILQCTQDGEVTPADCVVVWTLCNFDVSFVCGIGRPIVVFCVWFKWDPA